MNAGPWPSDANALTNGNGLYQDPSANPNLFDPSMNAMYNGSPFDPTQFQNAQLQQARMQNGMQRVSSPAVNPPYQVNPVVPSKRPRPRDDSIGGSPRQAPGSLGVSRSQTPQQGAYPGFPGSQPGGQQGFQAPTPYGHLQPGTSTATPSPIMPNQQFRPPAAPQRMQTVSPSPFSPAAHNFNNQMSPPPDQGSNVNTPQMASNPTPMPGMSMAQGYNPNFTPTPGMNPGMAGGMPTQGVPLTMNLQQRQAELQRQYQMRMTQQQQHLAMNNMAAMGRGGANPMMGNPAQMANNMAGAGGRMPPGMPQHQPNPQLDQFLRTVAKFMQQKGQPFNPNPMLYNRPINLFQLWSITMKAGGSRKASAENRWPMIAHTLGFLQTQFPSAAQEIRNVWERNLAMYEMAYWAHKMNKNVDGVQAAQMNAMQGGMPQMSPTRMMPPQGQDSQAQFMGMQQTPQPAPPDVATPARAGSMPNGFMTPQQDPNAFQQQNAMSQHRKSASRQVQATPPQSQQPPFPTPSPGPSVTGNQLQVGKPVGDVLLPAGEPVAPPPPKSPTYTPKVHRLTNHGEIDIPAVAPYGAEIPLIRPDVPDWDEFGTIDLHATSMSLQSGIHSEVRYALDVLAKVTADPYRLIELERSGELLESLIDCAEEQIDTLADESAEVSDGIDLPSYEEVIRSCRFEMDAVQEIAPFGTQAYDLDRAAERLICITTILRNLSTTEESRNPHMSHREQELYLRYQEQYSKNQELIAGSFVIKFMSNLIRLLGTRILFMRTHANTQDLMKDLVIILSNIADKVHLPSKEDTLNITHFLLSFAPSPSPTVAFNPPTHETLTDGANGMITPASSEPSTKTPQIRFTPFNPAVHRYLPQALDSLAKLLARDTPNRAHFKHVFTSAEAAFTTPPYEILTRAFSLAISPTPDRTARQFNFPYERDLAERRKPILLHGMLAADILTTFVPAANPTNTANGVSLPQATSDSSFNVAKAWLQSEDGWPKSISRLIQIVSTIPKREPPMPPQQAGRYNGRMPPQPHKDPHPSPDPEFQVITHRAMTVLLRLADKAGAEACKTVIDIFPQKETLMGALLSKEISSLGLKELIAYSGLAYQAIDT